MDSTRDGQPLSHYAVLDMARKFRAGAVGPKTTLMVLAERCQEHDPGRWACWPSQESIATDTEQDVRTVRRHLAKFVEGGLFTLERRSSPEGRLSNRYVLDLDVLASGVLTQPDTVSGCATGHPAHPNRTSDAPQPDASVRLLPISKEQQEEQQEGDIAADQFAAFWTAYPRRDGKRVGKAEVLTFWRKMTYEDRKAAWRGAVNLAVAVEAGGRFGVKDPIRFLRQRTYDDWQEAAEVRPDRDRRPNLDDRNAANIAAAVAMVNGRAR